MAPQTAALLTLSGEFDLASKERLGQFLGQVKNADVTVIDVSKVTFFDSTAISELMALHRRTGGAVRLVEPPAFLRRVLNICSLDSVLQIHDTLGSAIADITASSAIVTHTGSEPSQALPR